MLSLNNFESEISEKILLRGRQYYENGLVTDLGKSRKYFWEAEVEGSVGYIVQIGLKKDGMIKECSCNCPYEGEVCKHVVAVLFAIKNAANASGAKTSSKLSFDTLLESISASEYREFTKQYAATNKTFKTEFEIFFATKDKRIDLSDNYEKLIRKSIQKYSDGGFVDYRASYGLSNELDKILDQAHSFISKNNYVDAFIVAKVVLKLTMEAITHADDSAGNIGSIIAGAVEIISTIAVAEKAAIEFKEEVYAFLRNELQDRTYFDYGDFGCDLFGILSELAVKLGKPNDFISFTDQLTALSTGQYDDYRREFFQKQKIVFYDAIGDTEASERLINENINIVEVRASLVNKALMKKDFEVAKKLVIEGMKVAHNNKHPGTVVHWEKALLQIAVTEKDMPNIRYYAKKLAFEGWFNSGFYNQWKETYSNQEWPSIIESQIKEILADTKRNNERRKGNLYYSPTPLLPETVARIFIEEKYWDRLLELIKKEQRFDIVWQYHSWLAGVYPAEMIQIYSQLLPIVAEQANSRSAYANIVDKMCQMIKDIPSEKNSIKTLANDLRTQYVRRPAMVDELNRVLNNKNDES